MKVIHITPHLGGGVGSVLLSYLAWACEHSSFEHEVLSLEYANEKAKLASDKTGFRLVDRMADHPSGLFSAISRADIILIHWWNHPLLYALLVRESLPPARILFWSHISGLHAPYVFTRDALHYPDIFVFTSPLSFNVPEVRNLSDDRKKNLTVIWSTGGLEHLASISPKPHCGFNVGYIGTVDYGKMHPHFLKMCSHVNIPDVHFIVCGGPRHKGIEKEAQTYSSVKRFHFAGPVKNISDYLAEFDVFGYPLAPYHYGTCEQSLGEAMAAGIPPVVMANPAERTIVKNGVTGLVASSEAEYSKALETLYHEPDLRKRLGENARRAAKEMYSLSLMANRWETVFGQVMTIQKTPRRWTGKYQGSAATASQVFIESLGRHGGAFESYRNAKNEVEKKKAISAIKRLYAGSNLWKADTRGTARHYWTFFPEDHDLKVWMDLASEEDLKVDPPGRPE
jgi:glycosyltransferase involved in cell wall biosynthesis